MKKIIFFITLIFNVNAYDFYIGGGVAAESNPDMDSNDSIKKPSIWLIDIEFFKDRIYYDVGFGVSFEGNCSYTSYEGIQDGRKYDIIAPYGLVRLKSSNNRINPYIGLKYGVIPIVINKDKTNLLGISYLRTTLGIFYNGIQLEGSYGGGILIDKNEKSNRILPDSGNFNYALSIKKHIK